jgi:hypothetical protein
LIARPEYTKSLTKYLRLATALSGLFCSHPRIKDVFTRPFIAYSQSMMNTE